jgi:hypothetical protein
VSAYQSTEKPCRKVCDKTALFCGKVADCRMNGRFPAFDDHRLYICGLLIFYMYYWFFIDRRIEE